MLNTTEFIKNIETNARVEAEKIVTDAQKAKDDSFAMQASEHQKLTQEFNRQVEEQANQAYRQHGVAARIENSNKLLQVKQEQVNDVFLQTKKHILSLSEAKYKTFIEKLLQTHATNGDTVIIAESDKKRISKDFIEKTGQKLKINLTLSPKTHPHDGGIILEGTKFDKNLTLNSLLLSAREELEQNIIATLFV